MVIEPKARKFIILFLAVFLIYILTVESNQSSKGSLWERFPTCVETTIEFALAIPPVGLSQVHKDSSYALLSDEVLLFGTPLIARIHQDRAPPIQEHTDSITL
jgi:hypothetical protein